MSSKTVSKSKIALLLLVAATILFALASPMVKLLVQQGGKNSLQYPRSISFCNVLFVGNLCASLLVAAMFDTKKILLELKESNRRKKMMLLSSSLTAIIYPALIFTALEFTSVTNVVLLSRFEVIIFILLSLFLYKIQLNVYQHIGYIMIGVAVIGLTLVNDNFMFSRGDMLILVASVFFAVNSVLNKELLKLTSIPTFLFTRNFCSAFVFLAIGMYLYGWRHFQHAFQGNLWSIMLFYALIIIVLGQYLWFRYKTKVNFSAITWLLIINPFLAVFFAWLILGEQPNTYEIIAIVVIFIGLVISSTGTYHLRRHHSNAGSTLGNI